MQSTHPHPDDRTKNNDANLPSAQTGKEKPNTNPETVAQGRDVGPRGDVAQFKSVDECLASLQGNFGSDREKAIYLASFIDSKPELLRELGQYSQQNRRRM